jgi:hypothetical protein
MSTIPNKAIPHAFAETEGQESQESNGSSFLLDNARRLAETARENPKTALAVGAGVVAATAAATVALTRGRGNASSARSKAGKKD